MSETAAEKRAERRRQKILQNSEDRMKKIFGGQNYHEGHLQVAEMPSTSNAVENEDIANLDIAQFVRNIPRETTPADPTEGSSNRIHEVKRGTFWIFWFILGMIIRLVLTSKYSWVICDSSVTPYGLTFTVVNFLLRGKKHQGAAGGILDIIGLFAGLDANKIASIKFAYSIVTEFFNTLISYFAGFMLLDVVITNM